MTSLKYFKAIYATILMFALIPFGVAGVYAQSESTTHSDAASIAVGHHTPVVGTQRLPTAATEGGYAQKALQGHVVTVTVRDKHGHLKHRFRALNSRVDAGASAVANNVSGTQVAVFKYVALTADSGAVAKADTTCPSEISTGGLARTAGTFGNYIAPSSLNGTASYTITATYTATAGYTINKLCMFNAASAGTMLFETLLGATVTGNNGDTITVTWTVNV